MREGALNDSATPQSALDRIHTEASSLCAHPDVDVWTSYIEEYCGAAEEEERNDPSVAPLSTIRIAGHIRRAPAVEGSAGAWILRLGNPDRSD